MIDKQQISTYSKDRALQLTELLLECGYVCMLSKEEQLYIINYIETLDYQNFRVNEDCEADRNYVVFMSKEDFEDKYQEISEVEDEQ